MYVHENSYIHTLCMYILCRHLSCLCVGGGGQVILMHIPYLVFMTEIHCADDLSEELSCLRGGGYDIKRVKPEYSQTGSVLVYCLVSMFVCTVSGFTAQPH